MGSIISAIKDDYDDYKYFCEVLGIKTESINNFFYDHEKSILKKLGFKTKEDYYAMLRKAEHRENQINTILYD